MKTSLKYIALSLAVALPTVLAANALGLDLPNALSPTHVFGALVATLAMLTIVSDYLPRQRLTFLPRVRVPSMDARSLSASHKSKYPLAA